MSYTTAVAFLCRLIDFVQWTFIISVGTAINTFSYQEDAHRIIITIIGMAAGTIISHYIRKWLNKPNSKTASFIDRCTGYKKKKSK